MTVNLYKEVAQLNFVFSIRYDVFLKENCLSSDTIEFFVVEFGFLYSFKKGAFLFVIHFVISSSQVHLEKWLNQLFQLSVIEEVMKHGF